MGNVPNKSRRTLHLNSHKTGEKGANNTMNAQSLLVLHLFIIIKLYLKILLIVFRTSSFAIINVMVRQLRF